MKKYCMYLMFFCCFISSCSDDDNVVSIATQDNLDYSIKKNVKVITYDKLITDKDVEILNSDSSQISISKDMLDKNNIDISSGDAVDIWKKIDEMCFIRKVTKVESVGDRLIMTSSSAGLNEVFDSLNVNFSTRLYYDGTKVSTKTRASGGTDDYEAYVSGNDTIHPAVIPVLDENGNVTYHEAKDVLNAKSTRISIDDSWNFLNINHQFSKFMIPLYKDQSGSGDKSDSTSSSLKATMGIEKGYFSAKSNFDLSIHTNWFSVKDMKVGIHGSIDADLPIKLDLKGELAKTSKYKIASFSKSWTVFLVGPVPVVILFEPSLAAKSSLKLKGEIAMTFPFEYHSDFMGGMVYDGTPLQTYGNTTKTNENFGFGTPKLTASATVSASTGIYFEIATTLYGVTGPAASVGAEIEAKASSTFNSADSSAFKLATSASFAMPALLSWKVQIPFVHEISFDTPEFKFYEYKFWDRSYTVKDGTVTLDPVKTGSAAPYILKTGSASGDFGYKTIK